MRRSISSVGVTSMTAIAIGAAVGSAAMAIPAGNAAAAARAKMHPASLVVGNGDNGKTVSVPVGDSVVVRLSADNWTIAPSTDPAVLSMTGGPRQRRDPNCVPGGTCGTTRASFTALHQGTAVLSAGRSYCGEAIRCTPATDSWSVTVDVTAH